MQVMWNESQREKNSYSLYSYSIKWYSKKLSIINQGLTVESSF